MKSNQLANSQFQLVNFQILLDFLIKSLKFPIFRWCSINFPSKIVVCPLNLPFIHTCPHVFFHEFSFCLSYFSVDASILSIKKMVLDHLPFSIHVPMFILFIDFSNEKWVDFRDIQARFASLRRQLAAEWLTTQGGLSQGGAIGKPPLFHGENHDFSMEHMGKGMENAWKMEDFMGNSLCLIGKEIWKNGCKVKCRWKMQGIWFTDSGNFTKHFLFPHITFL